MDERLQSNPKAVAAWAVYGGVKVMLQTGELFKKFPKLRGQTSPFDQEFYARDALAEYWDAQGRQILDTDEYLLIMAILRQRGFLREYVWTYMRGPDWNDPEPPRLAEFLAFAREAQPLRLDQRHEPLTLAFAKPRP